MIAKIRIQGLPDDVQQTAERVKQFFTVVNESKPYQMRGGRWVSVYLTVQENDINHKNS